MLRNVSDYSLWIITVLMIRSKRLMYICPLPNFKLWWGRKKIKPLRISMHNSIIEQFYINYRYNYIQSSTSIYKNVAFIQLISNFVHSLPSHWFRTRWLLVVDRISFYMEQIEQQQLIEVYIVKIEKYPRWCFIFS